MLKLNQFVALIIAATCGIVSMAGSQPVAPSAPVPQAIQSLTAAYPPVRGPVILSDDLISAITHAAVPQHAPAPALTQRGAPERLVVASRAFEPDRYVPIESFMVAASSVGWQVTDTLLTVARCEAGADLDYDGVVEAIDVQAQSPTGDRGAMQVNVAHAAPGGIIERMGYGWDDMLSLGPNVAVGLALYTAAIDAGRDGFSPWTCRP